MKTNSLYSEDHISVMQKLMAEHMTFASSGQEWSAHVFNLAKAIRCVDVLDYGCGRGNLKRAIGDMLEVSEYDPAVEGKNAEPGVSNLVCCINVLHFVEPDNVGAVIDHMASKARSAIFIALNVGRPLSTVPWFNIDRHMTTMESEWWIDQINKRMKIAHLEYSDPTMTIMAKPVRKPSAFAGASLSPNFGGINTFKMG